MKAEMKRREFLHAAGAGSALGLTGMPSFQGGQGSLRERIISPGCVKSKVQVGKLYLGKPSAHWPTPKLDLATEMNSYEEQFRAHKAEFGDIDFPVTELVTEMEQIAPLATRLGALDGILIIHLSMGVMPIVQEILKIGTPAILFAAPYSGHEWTGFGALMKQEAGKKLDCILSSDFGEIVRAVRPFRAIHHLKEAKILNVTDRELSAEYCGGIKNKFGTEIVRLSRQRVLDAYNAVSDADAGLETYTWMSRAAEVREPAEDEIFRSCKLALAFERLVMEEEASVITVDCYGTMYRNLPAFPCIGFTRLNNMGLGGICESDLQSAMTHIILQGLTGKPGFISDPTFDLAKNSIILAHCLGSLKMDGPQGASEPYRIRTIMERQEGAVAQVMMRNGEKVTQAELIGDSKLLYFTGKIVDVPDTDRGCRTKISVTADGDMEKLWQNWSHGLHRVTCYGNAEKDLVRFCRFKDVELVNEA